MQEGPFRLIPGGKAETRQYESPIKALTTEEKKQLKEHLNAILPLHKMPKPTVASLLTMEVLLPQIKPVLNKIKLHTRIDDVVRALEKDLAEEHPLAAAA